MKDERLFLIDGPFAETKDYVFTDAGSNSVTALPPDQRPATTGQSNFERSVVCATCPIRDDSTTNLSG